MKELMTLGIPSFVQDTVGSWVMYERDRRQLPLMTGALAELWGTCVNGVDRIEPVMSSPFAHRVQCLYLTEDVGDRWRTGSCWALMTTEADRIGGRPRLVETLSMTRFAEFDLDGRTVCIQTQQRNDNELNFAKVEEIDAGRNLQTLGTVDSLTGIVKSAIPQTLYKGCPFCSVRNTICECAPSLTRQYFQRECLARRRRHRPFPGRDLRSRILYIRDWMAGSWSERVKNRTVFSFKTVPLLDVSDAVLKRTLARALQPDIEQLLKPTIGLLSIEDCFVKQASLPSSAENSEQKMEMAGGGIVANDEKQSVYSCPICNIPIKRKYDVQRHIRSVHEKRRDFQCPQCLRAFLRSSHLKDHMRGTHPDTSENMCVLCGKHFGMSSKLKRHMMAVHERQRNFGCPHCEKTYKENSALRRHMSRHHR